MNTTKDTPHDLPGNHGQFGTDRATEDYKPLPGKDDPGRTGADTSTSAAGATEANPGPKQTQGGMRS